MSISFTVLLLGETTDTQAADIHKLRPKPGVVDFCLRRLSELGVTCHRLDFGLACEASAGLFENLFGVTVTEYEVSGEPQPPEEIAQYVDQITIDRPPTLMDADAPDLAGLQPKCGTNHATQNQVNGRREL
jgi:hypothetical protein